jgi:hypothetical protein
MRLRHVTCEEKDLAVSVIHPVGAQFERHRHQRVGVITAEGWVVTVNFAELDKDSANTEQDELVVVTEETTEATAPMRHFHRAAKSRNLSSGPLANPRRTRLV